MDMRAESQWQSFTMTPAKWAAATTKFNDQLAKANAKKGLDTVPKHPRALIEKLAEVEEKILRCLSTGNYACEYHVLHQ